MDAPWKGTSLILRAPLCWANLQTRCARFSTSCIDRKKRHSRRHAQEGLRRRSTLRHAKGLLLPATDRATRPLDIASDMAWGCTVTNVLTWRLAVRWRVLPI